MREFGTSFQRVAGSGQTLERGRLPLDKITCGPEINNLQDFLNRALVIYVLTHGVTMDDELAVGLIYLIMFLAFFVNNFLAKVIKRARGYRICTHYATYCPSCSVRNMFKMFWYTFLVALFSFP